jgi:hypothetical protein
LKNCGYNEEIKYNKTPSTKTKNRKRNIIWYNPPFSVNVKTNVAKKFLSLVKKHFGINHRYHKIFNKNNIKVSYSCMPNMAKIINSHNKKILNNTVTQPNKTCSCRNSSTCPLNGHCLQKSVIYRADVTRTDSNLKKSYFGLCETEFKARYNNHLQSFNDESKEKATELSKYIWELKRNNINYIFDWSIAKQTSSYNPITKSCSLCLSEKFFICTFKEKDKLINKKSELVSKCRHEAKHLISKIKQN